MQILYDAEMNQQLIEGEKTDAQKIFSETIKSIDLVALPSKNKAADLLPSDDVGSNYDNIALIWSPDSKWCAFYYNQPRVGYTVVYRQVGDKFTPVNQPEDLRVDVKGDVRNEYISPSAGGSRAFSYSNNCRSFAAAKLTTRNFSLPP